jgi:hypothetical protein
MLLNWIHEWQTHVDMNNFRLAILAAQSSNGEFTSLQNNLAQAITWLGNTWQLTKPVHANFIIMLVTSAKSLKTLQTLQNVYPPGRFIVATSLQIKLPQIKWQLPFPKKQTSPSILSLVNLLSRVREHYLNQSAVDLATAFNSMEHFSGIIEQCRQDQVSRACSKDNGPIVVLLPKKSAYYFAGTLEQLVPIAAANRSSITVKNLSADEYAGSLDAFIETTQPQQNHRIDEAVLPAHSELQGLNQGHINDLLWLSVLIASRGRPISLFQLTDKISLLEIPDILLGEYFSVEYKKLIEIFISKPASVIEASKIAQRSLFDTINFYNACKVLNMTEIG